MRAQSQEHHIISHLEKRGVERGRARRSSIKGREMAILSQTNIGTVSKATLGELWRDGWSAYGLFQGHRYHLELNLPVLTFKASGIGYVQYFNEY